MAFFDVFALIEQLRQVTVQELEPLRTKGLQFPDLPDTITTGERVYETNLRAILRYLKHVNKACKRQDPDSCCNVLTYRGVIKQWHDVDEWATKTLLSLDVPKGLNGTEHDFTPDELREFLNASTTSPLACGAHPGDIAFSFDGSCREDTPDASPDLHHFRFRCVSDPVPRTTENHTTSQNPFTPAQVFGCPAESVPGPRPVSAPVSPQDGGANSFLQVTGETLEQFIASIEVEESKIENKKRWLLQLRSLESSCFLGRWPSPTTLQTFMQKHNLDWPVRISGKWDLTPKSFSEREGIKNEVVDKLFAKDIVCDVLSSAGEQVKEIDGNDTISATIVDAFVSGDYSPTNLAAGLLAGQDVVDGSCFGGQLIEGQPAKVTLSDDDPDDGHSNISAQKILDHSAQISCESVLVDESVAADQVCNGKANEKPDITEVASARDEDVSSKGLDFGENAVLQEELASLGEVDMSEAIEVQAEIDIPEEASLSDLCGIPDDVDTTEEFTAPEEVGVLGIIHTQEEVLMADELELHHPFENLNHIFVWVKSVEFARDSNSREQANLAEELERHHTHDSLSHNFVWLGSGESALDSDSLAELLRENPQHDQIEKAAVEEVVLSNLTNTGLSAEFEDCDLSVQDRESATDTENSTEKGIIHAAEVDFTACDEFKTMHDVNCSKIQAEYIPAIRLRIDGTDGTELPNAFEYDTSEEDRVDGDHSFFVHNSDGEISSLDTISDKTEETEITKKVIPASEGLETSNIGSKSEVRENLSLKIPTIVLTLSNGTEVDIETIPWKRRKRGKQTVNDSSRLAPPPRPKKSSSRDRSPGSPCSLEGCERCSTLSSKKSEVKTEKDHSVNNSKESEEKAFRKSTESSEWEIETQSGTKSGKQSQGKFAKKEPTKKEPTKKEPTKKEPTKKEPTKKEPTKKEPTKKEPTKKEPTKKEPTKKEPTKKERVKMAMAKILEKFAPTSTTPPSAYVNESAAPVVESNPTALTVSATDDGKSQNTPPRWSVTPILTTMALSALYVSARCPLLPALGIFVSSLVLKNKLGR